MWKTLSLTLTGVAPLLMHSGRLIDPLGPFPKAIKEVSGRRLKSDADHEELSRLEFLGGLWLGADGRPCLPSEVVEACLTDGAKKSREGKASSSGLLVEQDAWLIYDGPPAPADLYADTKFRLRVPARVGQARVMRTRPMFPVWSAMIAVQINTDLLNPGQVQKWARAAGEQVGVGDWRPKFGRFTVRAE